MELILKYIFKIVYYNIECLCLTIANMMIGIIKNSKIKSKGIKK